MKSIMSWLVLIVSITLLVSSCSTEDSSDQNFSDDSTAASDESTSTTDDFDPTLVVVVSTEDESAGSNCTHGGHKINTGYDKNADEILQASEITKSVYVCNGASGSISGLPYFTGTIPTTGTRVRHIVSHQRLQKPQVIT